jgi:hypothetical protein
MGSNDVFGQFAHCGAINFFEVVSKYIENISVPALGKASDGENCLTTRDFGLVDMDPADNVVTTYLVDPATGRTAQNSAVNQAVFTNTVVLKNGSDNLLLSTLDMVMGCKPFRVRNLVDINNPVTGGLISSMALDEIHAALRQTAPYAYLPKGDPMVRIGGLPNLAKLNAYRQGVFQPMVSTLEMAGTLEFCAHMTNVQLPRLQKNRNLFAIEPSPDMAVATNLFAFLANRFAGSFTGLNCGALLDIAPPVQVVMMGTVVTDATISIPAVIPTGSDDPYLINWRDYPGLDPTPVPTTPAPTTAAPTTPVPTTPVPTTPVPTTPVPTTPVPTTAAPTTAAPTTPVPTTPVPTTAAPTTAVPAASQSQMVVILSSMIAVFIIAGVVAWLKNCFVKKKEDGDYSEMQKV